MSGVIIRVRLTDQEWRQLLAKLDGETVSAMIREALYETYGIGSIDVTDSHLAPPCRTATSARSYPKSLKPPYARDG